MLCRNQEIKLLIEKNIILWYKTQAPTSLTPLAAVPEEIPKANAWWWKAEKKKVLSQMENWNKRSPETAFSIP